MTRELTFRVRGPFRVFAPDGRDITPRLAKAQGLLLLLLTGSDGSRGRAWVQDVLWSDRGPDQAAASLRQTLSVIRKALGEHRDILRSDRQVVALDMERVSVDLSGTADIAEGLDIRDPEFDAWLATERAHDHRPRPSPLSGTLADAQDIGLDRIAVVCRSDGAAISDWTVKALADALFLSLSENSHVEVFREDEQALHGDQPFHVVLELHCHRSASDRMLIRVAAFGGPSRRQFWSGHCNALLRGGPPIEELGVLRLIHNVVEAVTFDRPAFGDGVHFDPADEMMRAAISNIFSMQPDRISKADELLSGANEVRPSPLYLAWRLQIRTIQRLERHSSDEQKLREEGEYFAAHALEADHSNSMVFALLANANLFLFQNPHASLHFARLGMSQNPSNPMASWALSSARLYNGDTKNAYCDARRGRQMTMNSPRRFFWDLQLAASAMLLGRMEEATSLLKGITLQRPQFRPPLRYLIALEATRGREESAKGYLDHLKKLESDFSIRRLMQDRNYPASLVHRTNLIENDRVLSLR